MPRKITVLDIRDATGYDPGGLRAVLDQLLSVSCVPAPTKARAATLYSRADVQLVAVIHELESKFGLRRSAISVIGKEIKEALSRPRDVNPKARLVITCEPPSVRYSDGSDTVEAGIVMPLSPVFQKVDGYFGGGGVIEGRPLTLPPGVVRRARRRGGA